ncbi:hypothetical protein BRARA_J02433 [Brassica rapa]|uniref:Knottin scorpion toxin-like domain-containing protein n=1 Tax=Brassica campestris TaxID=3711 RepID=A0A397XN38_BRACM|nr:hypothetical protein BRARA_J02433 [Brassica rapa]
MANMKVFSFALLLVLVFAIDVEGHGLEAGASLCCNTHPKFGKCNPSHDKERCNRWCLSGCANEKGGYCKPSNGGQCHCYC